jgi:SAM-dependent MidA family methyltransferase
MTEHEGTRTAELAGRLIRRIREDGRTGVVAEADGRRRVLPAIPFREYMGLCLYDAEFGYYAAGPSRVGREGDFYTSADMGGVMAAVLARYANRLFAESGCAPAVFEWGAGTGRLGVRLLQEWRSLDPERASAVRYVMADSHAGHRENARRAAEAAGLAASVEALAPEEAEKRLQEADRPLLIANELLDAFPFRRIRKADGKLWEIGAAWDEREGRFRDALMPLDGPDAARLEAEGCDPAEGQEFEWGEDALAWLERTLGVMREGRAVLIDYGDEQEELLAPHRMKGTYRCYRRHVVHDDPYLYPGDQDITAHVNFTAVRRTAESCGWRIVWYGEQRRFLLENGALELLAEHDGTDPFSPAARRNRAVRGLLLGDAMGGLFKALVLERP